MMHSLRSGVELENVLDILLGSEEDGDTLVDAGRVDVEDALATGGGNSSSLLQRYKGGSEVS